MNKNDNNIETTIADIKNLTIQGATNVAKESIRAIGEWTNSKNWDYQNLEKNGIRLALARSTEPLARNAMYWFFEEAKGKDGQSLISVSNKIIAALVDAKEKIIEYGATIVKNNMTILTHCHSSTVTGILKKAHKKGINFKVYLTETRPRNQGQITAKELTSHGISSTMITDSEAMFMVSREDDIVVDIVLLGADAIEKDGSALNKVGSYGISLSAKQARIPVYVTATILKYAPFPIQIEEREGSEIWDKGPSKLKIFNPAFDRIPHNNIHSFITEHGLIKPEDIENFAKKNCPWIFTKHQLN